MEQVSPETARQYLRDVEPLWRAFWFHMHLMAKNLREFAHGLGEIGDDVFAYHVGGQKNDLSRWVREVIGDAMLAAELDQVHTKEEALAATKARLEELERAAA
jgi:hypothetical protein